MLRILSSENEVQTFRSLKTKPSNCAGQFWKKIFGPTASMTQNKVPSLSI
jgi:hypothetical protein